MWYDINVPRRDIMGRRGCIQWSGMLVIQERFLGRRTHTPAKYHLKLQIEIS
jgi:hypothetical protein